MVQIARSLSARKRNRLQRETFYAAAQYPSV
jgi:hypothetical protein